jgi:hypothetical protein
MHTRVSVLNRTTIAGVGDRIVIVIVIALNPDRDLELTRPVRPPPRPCTLAQSHFPPSQPSETPATRRRRRMVDAGPNFLGEARQLRERRRPTAPDGWIHYRHDNEPVVVCLIIFFSFCPTAYAPCSLPHLSLGQRVEVILHQV